MMSLIRVIGKIMERLMLHEIPMRSGAVAFAALFAVGPLILLLLTLISSFNLDLKTELLHETERIFGQTGSDLMVQIISENARIGWSSVVVLIISSAAIFGQIHDTLMKIFGLHEATPDSNFSFFSEVKLFIKTKVFSIGIVIGFIVLSFLSLLISSIISVYMSGGQLLVGGALDDLITFVGFSFIFSVLIFYTSSSRVKWSISFIGGVFTSFLFTLGKRGISIYLAQTEIDNLYGTAGSLAGLLVWIYYSSLIFFLGAELSAVLAAQKKFLRRAETIT